MAATSQRRRRIGSVVAALAATVILAGSSPAAAEEYESLHAGHPLRIIAYVAHPVGVILEWLIFRPAHWVGSHEPIKTLVGQTD